MGTAVILARARTLAALVISACASASMGASGCGDDDGEASAGADGGARGGEDAGADTGAEVDAAVIDYDIARGRECPDTRFPPGYAIDPGLSCPLRPGSTTVRDCVSGIECVRDGDCTAKPFGRCSGSGGAQCSYPIELEPCTEDADCTALTEGVCPLEVNDDVLCMPSGECAEMPRRCHYRAFNQVCERDDECTAAAGGECRKVITHTYCDYQACAVDEDCLEMDLGARCACTVDGALACVAADCLDDLGCGPGQECRQDNVCGFGPFGDFTCTTADDECRSDDDCTDGDSCAYDEVTRRWTCQTLHCTVP